MHGSSEMLLGGNKKIKVPQTGLQAVRIFTTEKIALVVATFNVGVALDEWKSSIAVSFELLKLRYN